VNHPPHPDLPRGWQETGPDDPFVRAVAACHRAHLNALPDAIRNQMHDLQHRAQQQAYRAAYPDHRTYLISHLFPAGAAAPEETIGYALVNWNEVVTLIDVALHPDWQGRGHGGAALAALQRWADRPVVLNVARGNRAEGLYRRAGFQPCGGDELNLRMRWVPAASP
jgi:GNAT superfamily N-acetyltransferase